jgi:pimeloyl-ACP methyl ester carboxylesterase
MKHYAIKSKLYPKILVLILSVIFVSSCHNIFDGDEEPPVNEYLLDYELKKSYLPVIVETVFDQLVDEYPDIEQIRDRVSYGIMVYKLTYKTTFRGEEKMASGLACIPIGEGNFPVISYQNGTNTLHSNAPTENPNRDLYMMLEFVASTGFVISLPDYLGFGSSDNMFHPYLHKESTVQSTIDMLRAVREFAMTEKIGLLNEFYITGYSQGGWATMNLQKTMEQEYSGEFDLMASVPCAGPYDLTYINEYIRNRETYPMPYFLGYIANSYINSGEMTTPLDAIFNESYASKIPGLYDGSKDGEEINEELTTNISELLTDEYLHNFETDTIYSSLKSALETNSISAWNTSVPTRIVHGTADDFVPYQISKNTYDDFIDLGVSTNKVTLIPLEGMGHTDGIIPAGLISINWFLTLHPGQ